MIYYDNFAPSKVLNRVLILASYWDSIASSKLISFGIEAGSCLFEAVSFPTEECRFCLNFAIVVAGSFKLRI